MQRKLYLILVTILINLLPSASAAADEILFNHQDTEINATLLAAAGEKSRLAQLKITTKNLSGSNIFSLENPNRIVVDLSGASAKKNKTYNVINNDYISAIRFGAHPDKIRIVIDIKSNKIPPYKWIGSTGSSTLTIGGQEIAITATPLTSPSPDPTISTAAPTTQATETPAATLTHTGTPEKLEDLLRRQPTFTASPTATVVASHTSTATVTVTPSSTPTFTPSFQPTIAQPAQITSTNTPVPTNPSAPSETQLIFESQTQENPGKILKAIEFAYGESVAAPPLVKIILSQKSQFELQKKNDKTYLLSVDGFQFAENRLRLAQFPPHDFVGLTVVQAKEEANGISIEIGVERNVRISAAPKDNEIQIRVLQEAKTLTQSAPAARKP